MQLKHNAIAGTLESSDAQVMVEPADELSIVIRSEVSAQYGKQIRESIDDVLAELGIDEGSIVVQDQGALDCTLRARVQTAIFRANDMTENLPWGTKL